MSPSLKHLKVVGKEAHTATIIFLHGLGDTGHGWLPVAQHLWPKMPHVKFILPHAPEMPITLNGGMTMPGWFDIIELGRFDNAGVTDAAGMDKTVEAVDRLIQAEVDSGIPEDRIVLGGFSQGGAISVLSLLSKNRNLAGYICLSTWLPLAERFKDGPLRPDATQYPVFWGHGQADNVVEFKYGKASVERLEQMGFPLLTSGPLFQRPGLRFESYRGMGHACNQPELAHLEEWLKGALPPAPKAKS